MKNCLKFERIFYYDFLRFIAIITVIACHVSGGYDINFILNQSSYPLLNFYVISFFNHASQVGVPIFVMLSGALLINRDYSFKNFFKKRFTRVIIPFLFWTFIIILVELFFSHSVNFYSILNIFLAKPKTKGHILWFVWMIICVYCLIFLFNKLIHHLKLKEYDDHNYNKFLCV